MKKLHYIFILASLLLTFSCKEDLTSEGVSKETTHVAFELTDGPFLTIPKGKAYVDPGIKATQGTTDLTSTVKVKGAVDGMNAGLYTLTYSAANSDGFITSTERTVIVYDPAAPAIDLSGDYSSSVKRVDPARSFTDLKVSIEKLAPGFFYISDFIGGFYDQGSNYKYGSTAATTGYFQLNADNTITHVSSNNVYIGGSLQDLTNGKYDPSTNTLSWDAFYVDYEFKVTLEKN
jgi:hypothetical protein